MKLHEFTTSESEDIIKSYIKGESFATIASRMNVGYGCVGAFLKRSNITIRKGGRLPFKINHDAFSGETMTPEQAYWIGFLMADGCISHEKTGGCKIILQLSEPDGEHVASFREFLKADYKISVGIPKKIFGRHNIRPIHRISVSSWKISNDLGKFGVVPKKSMTAKVSNGLEFDRDFWRGVVDGDGWIGITKRKRKSPKDRYPVVSVTGSFDLISQWRDFARTISDTYSEIFKSRNSWLHAVNGSYAVRMIRVLYENCHVALPRKLAIANQILEKF